MNRMKHWGGSNATNWAEVRTKGTTWGTEEETKRKGRASWYCLLSCSLRFWNFFWCYALGLLRSMPSTPLTLPSADSHALECYANSLLEVRTLGLSWILGFPTHFCCHDLGLLLGFPTRLCCYALNFLLGQSGKVLMLLSWPQHALDATLLAFYWNFQHALGVFNLLTILRAFRRFLFALSWNMPARSWRYVLGFSWNALFASLCDALKSNTLLMLRS